MIKVIVYVSNSGFTAQFAKNLADRLGLPVFELKAAQGALEKHTPIVFLGWLMGGAVKGYKKAKRRFDVKLACGVGMAPPSEKERLRVANQNGIDERDFVLLQGGYDSTRLHGGYKFAMSCIGKIVSKALTSKLNKGEELSESDREMLELTKNGKTNLDFSALDAVENTARSL